MKVILRSDVPALGRSGEVKQVSDGFARNYLFPRSLAAEAGPAAMKAWESSRDRRAKKTQARTEEAKGLAAKISGVSLSFSRPSGAEGKLFGSVGKSDIVKSLKTCGYTVDKNAVILESPIRTLGEHEVELRLLHDVGAKVKVTVAARQ
ncbi:MAG TPA: 50S ribosomal protein L9 [Elusimicrobiota bacterium]|nr:50S ribosomal protein L9 [Elusimicrobiota bacterium]